MDKNPSISKCTNFHTDELIDNHTLPKSSSCVRASDIIDKNHLLTHTGTNLVEMFKIEAFPHGSIHNT